MELELGIIREPYASGAKQRVRVFGEAGGTVGRAPDNYWVLPDPKNFLSGHHCDIFFRDGAFWVRDKSRNGVFVNGSEQPLGYGHKARLSDGDVLTFATYRVRVRLRAGPGQASDVLHPEPEPELEPETEREVATSGDNLEPAEITGEHATGKETGSDEAESEAQPGAAEALEDTGEHRNSPSGGDSDGVSTSFVATQTLEAAASNTGATRVIRIDRARLQADGQLPPKPMERLISNQFRHIKRPLIRNALGKGVEQVPNGHLVMITSALPGEGKSFSSINLALSIAREKDLEVVLIDADVAKKDISRVFGVQEEPGLLNALADDLIDVERLILPTDVKGLGILPAGYCAEEDIATELLASSRMDEVAARIGARSAHRLALFDSPPLLLTNESRVIAALMGQIVMVVRAGHTPRAAVQEAIGYVDEDKPLGLVLNQSAAGSMSGYYGYGYYGYGAYGTYGEQNTENRSPPGDG